MGRLVLVGDEAFTADEYAAHRRKQDRHNARRRARRMDPEYRARINAYQRAYYAANADRLRAYQRDWKREARRAA